MQGSVIFIILFLLVLIFLIWGIHQAFISSSRLVLEINKKQGSYAGKTWGHLNDRNGTFLGTLVVSAGILTVVYSLSIGEMLNPVWLSIEKRLPPSAANYLVYIHLLIEIIIASTIILFTVFFARSVFKSRSKSVVKSAFFAGIASFFFSAFEGLDRILVNTSQWILKYIFNVRVNELSETYNNSESEYIYQQVSTGRDEEKDEIHQKLFENALTLKEVRIRECLVPRKEIIAFNKTISIDDLRQKFIETQLSKLIIYDGNIDNIIGYIHQLEMFKNPVSIKEMLLPIPIVPESMPATDLLNKFSKERKTIAWVIDEFGGTAGIVTMEDLQEEIFGDIKDEYDDLEEYIDKQLSVNEYLFSGRLELDDIEAKYRLALPEKEETHTLSGYIIQHNDGIPREKQKVIVGDYEFDIISVSETRIETVKMKRLV